MSPTHYAIIGLVAVALFAISTDAAYGEDIMPEADFETYEKEDDTVVPEPTTSLDNTGILRLFEQEVAAPAPPACDVPTIGTFGDVRSGNLQQTGSKSLGNMPAATAAREVAFQYKYVVGYCKTKHHGTGPTLQMKVGDREVWKHQINLATGDFPYDKNCGGYPHNYSPEQKAVFTIPAGVGGDVKLYMIVKDRNIHVVGSGLKCADAPAPGNAPAPVIPWYAPMPAPAPSSKDAAGAPAPAPWYWAPAPAPVAPWYYAPAPAPVIPWYAPAPAPVIPWYAPMPASAPASELVPAAESYEYEPTDIVVPEIVETEQQGNSIGDTKKAIASAEKEVAAAKKCNTDTGGTCRVVNCYSWRKATCKKSGWATYKCMCFGKCAVKGPKGMFCKDLVTPATKKLRCLNKKVTVLQQGEAANADVKSAQAAVASAQKGVAEVKGCKTDTGGTCRVVNCYGWRHATCVKKSWTTYKCMCSGKCVVKGRKGNYCKDLMTPATDTLKAAQNKLKSARGKLATAVASLKELKC